VDGLAPSLAACAVWTIPDSRRKGRRAVRRDEDAGFVDRSDHAFALDRPAAIPQDAPMTWTLYGDWDSGATILEIMLNEAAVPFEFRQVSLARDQQLGDAFAAINPMRRLPALVAPDGTVVTESLAGMLVLAEHSPAAALLPPPATPARATALRWMAFLAGELYGAVGRFDYPERYTADPAGAAALRDAAMAETRRLWSLLDGRLRPGPYALGDTFSALDAQILVMSRWTNGPAEWVDANCPRIAEVVRATAARPAAAAIWTRNYEPPRSARPDEAGAIAALVEAAYAAWVPVVGQRPGPMDDDYPARVARGEAFIVAEASGALAGLVVLEEKEGAFRLDNVAVAPAYAGKGLGRRLIRFAEAEARGRGYDAIRLYTHQRMERNVALYRGLGYAETGRGVEHGFARVYMEKRLAG
jgi:GST-like protein